jgi:hypothetical protein
MIAEVLLYLVAVTAVAKHDSCKTSDTEFSDT